MLTKVSYLNYKFGTPEIIKYSKNNTYELIQDNLEGLLLVLEKNQVYLYNYYLGKKINYQRIPIKINEFIIWKQINSFDQNNPTISNKIRNRTLEYLQNDKSENILGIGGEYYVYFKLLKYNNYIGISNHESIVSDSKFNLSFESPDKLSNYLVDYNNLDSYPVIQNNSYDVVINVVNIHENIIKYISKLRCNKIILITCKPLDKKISMLNKYLKLKKVSHFLNINSWITIGVFSLV